jgi:predicted nucleic acid-binding protein
VLLDTGPLIASLNASEQYHPWAVTQFKSILPPLLTCEAVISEACFLLRTVPEAPARVFDMMRCGALELPFHLSHEITAVQRLIKKYADIPASLADACLVRMSEIYGQSAILTLHSDFRVYRRHGRQAIPVIMPEQIKSGR